MRVWTTKGKIIQLDNLRFSSWMFNLLVTLQGSNPSLRLEGVEVHTGKKVRVALMELDLESRVRTRNINAQE